MGMLVRSDFDGSEAIGRELGGCSGLKLVPPNSSYPDSSYDDSSLESDRWSSGELVPVEY